MFRALVIHKLFTGTINKYISIIIPKFYGKNFNRYLVFGNEIFLNLMKKIGKIPRNGIQIIKREKKIVGDLEKLQNSFKVFFLSFCYSDRN